MIGQIPLVNFCEPPKTMLGQWIADGVVARADSGPDVPLARAEEGFPAAWLDMDAKTAVARSFLEALSAVSRGDRGQLRAFLQTYYAEDAVVEGAIDFSPYRVQGRQAH